MKVTLENMTKTFDGKKVLDNLNFTVESSTQAAIVGPNGTGKTTLVRILNLLDSPTDGDIYFDGVSIREAKEKWRLRRRMAVVFQRPAVFNMSVYENVAVGLKVRGFENIDEKVKEILRAVGLEKHKEANARKLSGGEKQLLALARAIVLKPELLLLDEPTSNLDTENAEVAENMIKNVDATVIFMSPRKENARFADRIIDITQ